MTWDWRDGNDWSYSRPRFDLQHPQGSTQLSLSRVLRDLTPAFGLHGYQANMWYTDNTLQGKHPSIWNKKGFIKTMVNYFLSLRDLFRQHTAEDQIDEGCKHGVSVSHWCFLWPFSFSQPCETICKIRITLYPCFSYRLLLWNKQTNQIKS